MKKNTWVKSLSLVSQLGFTMITPILFCLLIGSLIDDKTGKEPLFTIIFILLGVGGAFRNLFYYVGKEIKGQNKGDEHDEHE